jgi:hypothetical protein
MSASDNPDAVGMNILLSKDNKKVIEVNIISNSSLDWAESMNGRLIRIPNSICKVDRMRYPVIECLSLEQIRSIGCYLEGYVGHKVSWVSWINQYLNKRFN